MTATTIAWAPLAGMNKKLPEKGIIPNTTLKAATPPSFVEQYGTIIFLVLCILFATYVLQPLFEDWWGSTDPANVTYVAANANKFTYAYVAYGIFCLAVYYFLIVPWLNLPKVDLASIIAPFITSSVALPVAGIFALYFTFVR
jgi:hypothetical protein